jgi:hypothetical protein
MGVEWHYSRSSNPTTTLKNGEEGSEHHFFCILSPLRFLSIACEVQYIRVGTPRYPLTTSHRCSLALILVELDADAAVNWLRFLWAVAPSPAGHRTTTWMEVERRDRGWSYSRRRASPAPRRGGPICAAGGEELEPRVMSPVSGGGRRWRRNGYISMLEAMAGANATRDFFLCGEESGSRWRLLVFWDTKIMGSMVICSRFYAMWKGWLPETGLASYLVKGDKVIK